MSIFISKAVQKAASVEAATITVGDRFQKINPIKASVDNTNSILELYERLDAAIDALDYNSPNFIKYGLGLTEFEDRKITIVDWFLILHIRLYGEVLKVKKERDSLANLGQKDDATDKDLAFAIQQYNFFLMTYAEEGACRKAQAILAACQSCNRPKLFKALISCANL